MSRWRGGWNKTHGTAENTPRIDSYEAGAVEGRGKLFGFGGGKMLTFDCYRYTEYGPGPDVEREIAEVWHEDGWGQTLELSRKVNGFGGSQAFFLCPACGERRRYLYLSKNAFVCRKCAKLNYKSQQETRSDSMYFYHKGLDLVEKHLEPPPFFIDGFGFNRWIPEGPRYMHNRTYLKYLRRFAKYQDQHHRRQLGDMARLLGLFK